MLFYNRITRSLCAVFLCIGLLLTQSVYASEGDGGTDSQGENANYVYAIDIEFGNLAFYYDYGVWNVNTMRYETASTSTYPAVGTESGFPGWYGFDGTSNQIKIINKSTGGYAVEFELTYRPLDSSEWGDAGVTGAVSGVTMAVTDETGIPVADMTVPADENVPAYWYVHLSGEPKLSGGAAYESETMNPIGMLTIRIVDWERKTANFDT